MSCDFGRKDKEKLAEHCFEIFFVRLVELSFWYFCLKLLDYSELFWQELKRRLPVYENDLIDLRPKEIELQLPYKVIVDCSLAI